MSVQLKITEQIKEWIGNFGKKHADRNALTFNEIFRKKLEISREDLNNLFIAKMNRNIKILEVE